MKKFNTALALLLVVCTLCGCTQTPADTTAEDGTTEIITTDGDASMTGVTTDKITEKPDDGKYFIFRIWNFNVTELTEFRCLVDGAQEHGFNAIKIHIPWLNIEKKPGIYDYSAFDRMTDYVISRGMKVAVSLDMTRRWTDGMQTDGVVNEAELAKNASGAVGAGGAWFNKAMISFSSESGMDKVRAFYKDAVSHYEEKYSDNVLFYLPAFSLYCETEYYSGGQYDYSENAKSGFISYLRDKYKDIAALNAEIGKSYKSFEEISAPSATYVSDGVGLLWYKYRQYALKSAIDSLADITHKNENAEFAIQLGSVFDSLLSLRGTADFTLLCEKADVLWVDDAPSYDHNFSTAYVRSIMPQGVDVAQEIDGPHTNGTAEQFKKQGLQCFRQGCKYVSIANWSYDQAFGDDEASAAWREISDSYIKAEGDVLAFDKAPELQVSLYDILVNGAASYIKEYNRLSGKGKTPVKFVVTETVNDTAPKAVSSLYSFPRDFSETQGEGGWYYRQYNKGFSDITYDSANSRWKGSGDFTFISPSFLHPDTKYLPAVSFMVPKDGEYFISFTVQVESPQSNGVGVRIYVNDTAVYPSSSRQVITGNGTGETSFALKAGDMISLVLDGNGEISYDTSAVRIDIGIK